MTYSKMIDVEKSIFISRNLKPDSLIRSLNKQGFTIYDQSLLEFEGITLSKTPDSVWLFFYSRNAVKYFLAVTQDIQLEKYKIACLGQSAADEWENKTGKNVPFIGSGDPENVCDELKTVLKNESITFVRADNSKRSIIEKLPPNQVSELIIYRNRIKTNFDIPKSKFLIFTSPLNAEAYISKYGLQNDQVVICIGKTTATSIPESVTTYIPNEPNEASILDLIIQLVQI